MSSNQKKNTFNKTLSGALLELSDALEELAFLLARQKNIDKKQTGSLQVISQKLRKAKSQIEQETRKNIRSLIRKKWRKNYIVHCLQEKNCYIGAYSNHIKVDNKLYKTAEFLAEHYRELLGFYKKLKRHQSLREDFIFHTPANAVKIIQKWSRMLLENKIINGFEIIDDNTIDVDINRIHEATQFINGLWLEIYLRRELAGFLKENLIRIDSFDILTNAEIVLPDKTNTEIDLMLMINERIFWFECKTGDIGKYYQRYAKQRNFFHLDEKHAFLVVPVMKFNQTNAATNQSGMTMLYADQLEQQLKHIFRDVF